MQIQNGKIGQNSDQSDQSRIQMKLIQSSTTVTYSYENKVNVTRTNQNKLKSGRNKEKSS